MKVSGFMIPAKSVVRVNPSDTVKHVMDLMMGHGIGALVVLKEQENDENQGDASLLPIPLGIITKSDIVKAYQNKVPITDPCVAIMNQGELKTCTANTERDQAASLLADIHTHHLIVLDEQQQHFVGLISSFDITAECAKDSKAWPWLRNEDGVFSFNFLPKLGFKPAPAAEAADDAKDSDNEAETIWHHKHDNAQYEDYLDLMGFQ